MGSRKLEPVLGREEADELLRRLNGDAVRIAGRFGLVYRAILPERRSAGHYGICYEDGLIKVRLEHATRRRALKYSSLVHTLCHELSHLRHFNHGPGFRRFLDQVLGYARQEGIYRPGSRHPPRDMDCGVAPEERQAFLDEMRRAAEVAGGRRERPPQHLPGARPETRPRRPEHRSEARSETRPGARTEPRQGTLFGD